MARKLCILTQRPRFTGPLTVVEDEPHPPYDRPPPAKQVLPGQATADSTEQQMRRDGREWRLGVHATGENAPAK